MIQFANGSYKPSILTNHPLYVGVVAATLDPLGERLIVMDRRGKTISQRLAPPNSKISVVVPFEYTIDNNLMCILLDDDGEKDGELVDNVKATAVDLKTYTPSV